MLSHLTEIDLYSDAYRQNPYPYFQKMRAQHPIYPLKGKGHWAISRYEDVKKIIKNHDLFSSADIVQEPKIIEPHFLFYTRGIVGVDKPDHTRLRQLLHKLFPQNKITILEPFIRQCCCELLRSTENEQSIDFVGAFSAPLPIMIIAKLLGVDSEKTDAFRRWVLILLTWRSKDFQDKDNSIADMFNYLTEIINYKKLSPQSDLISSLIIASERDNMITQEEVLGFIRFLLVGGTDTTTNLLGNALRALLFQPDYIQLLKNQPEKIRDFIEEVLRYDGPVLSLYRRVTQDVELHGVTIKKNDLVFPLIASANHDETVFANPESFDIDRQNKSHLSFGTGIHYCFASQLAKLQVRVAFEEILKSWRFVENSGNEPSSYIESFFFRGPKKIPITIYR